MARRTCKPALVPVAQVNVGQEAGAGGWESTGTIPAFRLDGPFPYGLVRFSCKASSEQPRHLQLYIEGKEGIPGKKAFETGLVTEKEELHSLIIALEPTVTGLRLIAGGEPGRFTIRAVKLTRMDTLGLRLAAIRSVLTRGDKPLLASMSAAIASAILVLRTSGYRGLKFLLEEKVRSQIQQGDIYGLWIKSHVLTETQLEHMKEQSLRLSQRPLFSIVVPVYNADERSLRRCIESVIAQAYPYWELCLADDASTKPHVRRVLQQYQALDSRVKAIFPDKNGHISVVTNSALLISAGDFICLMDTDDEIAADALFEVARLLNLHPDTDMIYSDEDKIDAEGKLFEPFFKPDWSPEYVEAFMYTGRLACYRSDLARRAGGFRSDYEGAWEYDFLLRFIEQTQKIGHVAKILYHRSASAGGAALPGEQGQCRDDIAVKALKDRLNRLNKSGTVLPGPYQCCFDTKYDVTDKPPVSIIIPSAGKSAKLLTREIDMLSNCVNSISAKTTYTNYEIVVVDNNDLTEHTLNAIQRSDCRFVHYEGQVNIAAKMNLGARHAGGTYLLFLNDDIEVISPDWLDVMLQLFQRPGVGVVGAKLYFEDMTIQHVGVVLTGRGIPEHVLRGTPGFFPGYFFSSVANRNYLAVTGACLMTRKDVFEGLQGFNPAFAINYNDIDYCLRVHEAGFRIVFAAQAQLFHYEAKTGRKMTNWHDHNLFKELWGFETKNDPYYNMNLRTDPPNFQLKP